MANRLSVATLVLLTSLSAVASPLDKQMREVEQLRGAKFLHDVQTRTIARADLPRYLKREIEKSMPYSFDDYALVLETLRFIDPSAKNIEQSMLDLLQQQVLAFYDPMSHVYYAISGRAAGMPDAAQLNDILDEGVAVHELTHALQDQRWGIGKKDFDVRYDWDASMALHAVIEGDASLVMLAQMSGTMGQTIDDIVANDTLVAAIAGAATTQKIGGADTPPYFAQSLAMPYVAGLNFVITAYRRGGWPAVNRIYADPPRSTRELLHPAEYFAGKHTANAFDANPPFPVPHLLSVEHLGEWHWGFLLGAKNAVGWAGDRVTIAQDAFCNPTVLVETKWDTPEEARAFQSAYGAFLAKQKIDARSVAEGTSVKVAYGADPALIETFIPR